MSVQLRPMRGDEFVAWSDDARAWYAQDLAENGGVRSESAHRKTEADMAARALYRNLGYDVAAVHMLKALT